MENILVDLFKIGGGAAASLGVIYLLTKAKLFRLSIGETNGQQHQINELFQHAHIANKEMGEIREDIAIIKSDIGWIKNSLQKT